MGIFSTNTKESLGDYTFGIAEGYDGPGAMSQILIESYQNDMSLFNSVMAVEFKEATDLANGIINESNIGVIQEGFISNFIDKVKEIFVKLIEKVKAIIKAFEVKFLGIFIRDNKKFVDKYKAEVKKKDLSKMKYKISKRKNESFKDSNSDFKINDITKNNSIQYLQDIEEKYFTNDYLLRMKLASLIGANNNMELSEFDKEAHSYIYEDEEEETNANNIINPIMNMLSESSKVISEIKKSQSKMENICKYNIKSLQSAQTKFASEFPEGEKGSISFNIKDGNGEIENISTKYNDKKLNTKELLNKKLNLLYKYALIEQSYVNKLLQVQLTEIKFGIKQSRRIFAQAAAFNPKSVKESTELRDYVCEASDYEFDTIFESYETADIA